MGLAKALLHMAGWRVICTVPDLPKAIICVAPHTSNLDFIIGKLAYASLGRKAGFLMKSSWFFFPLGLIFKAMGGVPVYRGKGKPSLTAQLIDRFNKASRLVLAITPEGTRSLTHRWHTGFLHIAYETGTPIVLGAIDFARKEVWLTEIFTPTGDAETDLRAVKEYYRPYTGRHPDQFSAD
ncbi:MAG: 1-acyl-sn-glycerol-3-phosphate acyltransferase [Pseudoflavonifractor sp.]|nr:1-acyl-sn-glycerol-3-phosphate acyltransferase [Alloprevotella sp.]MCM1117306.1 1-acyl-sn-glycerol-3-phosphate acyltransferase [Pseudoflavonifractor sp.]